MGEMDRFLARATANGFGVFDRAVNGWHGRQDITEREANELAERLSGAVESHHARPAPGSRQVEPPKPVVVRIREIWEPGLLDWWFREADGWHGRIRFEVTGKTEWLHANKIREA